MAQSHFAGVMSPTGSRAFTAALFTSTSTIPNRSRAAARVASIWSRSPASISAPMTRSSPNSATNPSTVSSVRRGWTSVTTTDAPSCSSRRAVALPMPPPAAPVTSATRPPRSYTGYRSAFLEAKSWSEICPAPAWRPVSIDRSDTS